MNTAIAAANAQKSKLSDAFSAIMGEMDWNKLSITSDNEI